MDKQPLLIRTILLGEDSVGKSRFLDRFALGEFLLHSYWAGPDFVSVTQRIAKLIAGAESLKLFVWDVVGIVRFRRIAQSYFRGAKGVLILYSITDYDSFLSVSYWASEVQTYAPTAVRILIGTKADLRQERKVSYDEGRKLAETIGAAFVETSAKENVNVDQAFHILLAAIGAREGTFSASCGFQRS